MRHSLNLQGTSTAVILVMIGYDGPTADPLLGYDGGEDSAQSRIQRTWHTSDLDPHVTSVYTQHTAWLSSIAILVKSAKGVS